jgi:hypothetical protein
MKKQMKQVINGGILATAVAGLFVAGIVSIASAEDVTPTTAAASVKCSGVNECKGKGECSAADGSHDCKGKNACKGKGVIMVGTEKDCTDKTGKVEK